MVICEDQNCISLLPNDQQQDFPPNSKQTFICSVTEATSHLQIRVSRLYTCTHYIMIYNSSSQEGKLTNFQCYDFSVLPSVVYLGWLPPASSLHFYLMTLSSLKKYLWRKSWQPECYTDMLWRKNTADLVFNWRKRQQRQERLAMWESSSLSASVTLNLHDIFKDFT